MKTLGICIPTYKRPEHLRSCVVSAIESANGRPIRIFISDDSVSDVNESVFAELQQLYPFIFVHRNESNLGIDANIQRVVDSCDCDFGWLIGEDDRFLPGAVGRMHDRLQADDAPFIFANYAFVTEDHSEVLRLAVGALGDTDVPVPEFIASFLPSIGFIGCVVVRLSDWKGTDRSPYLGTYFAHVGRIVDMLADCRVVGVVGGPSVANRSQGEDTFTWKKDSFGVFLGFERMCRIAAERNPQLNGALKLASDNYRVEHAYLSLKSTFRLRSQGAFDMRQFLKYISPAATIGRWRKLWLLLLAVTPRTLLRPFAHTYQVWAARRRRRSLLSTPL